MNYTELILSSIYLSIYNCVFRNLELHKREAPRIHKECVSRTNRMRVDVLQGFVVPGTALKVAFV